MRGSAADIDAVVISTCTGYLCPAEQPRDRRPRCATCTHSTWSARAAARRFRTGASPALLGAGARHVLSICVEGRSAAMYLDDDPGVLISACLFGDGAGPRSCRDRRRAGSAAIEWRGVRHATNTAERDALKFDTQQRHAAQHPDAAGPAAAAEHAALVLDDVLAASPTHRDDIRAWIMHAGGRDVLGAVREDRSAAAGRPAPQRGDAARVREHEQRVRLLRAAGGARRRHRGRMVVALGIRRGFSCHGRTARSRVTRYGAS
jgi:alkylresorcinol/alkylpyrone synthase